MTNYKKPFEIINKYEESTWLGNDTPIFENKFTKHHIKDLTIDLIIKKIKSLNFSLVKLHPQNKMGKAHHIYQ